MISQLNDASERLQVLFRQHVVGDRPYHHVAGLFQARAGHVKR
jgi:hypothetical protein